MSTAGGADPELRIGDAEREAAVSALGDHYAAGRLTKEEYDERSADVYRARTRSALWPLFADLPRPEGARAVSEPSYEERRIRPGWFPTARLLPVLLAVLVISIVVGHPVILLVVLGVLLLKVTRFRHHAHGRGRWRY